MTECREGLVEFFKILSWSFFPWLSIPLLDWSFWFSMFACQLLNCLFSWAIYVDSFVFILCLTYLLASVYPFCIFAFVDILQLLFIDAFLRFLTLTSLGVSAEIHWLWCCCCCFLRQIPHMLMVFFQCCSMVVTSFSNSSCSTWILLKNFSLYNFRPKMSLSRSTLHCLFFVVVSIQIFFNLSFSLAGSRWWSDATSAPIFTRTSWNDLLVDKGVVYLVLCNMVRWYPRCLVNCLEW